MAEHPNIGRLREVYEAFAKGDMATLTELFSQDIVWHWPGACPLCGDHVGRDAVFAVFGKMAELSGDFRAEVHDILANDEHAVALTRSVGSNRHGKQMNMPNVDVCHIREGKVTEFWSFAMDQRAEDEFWS